MSLDDIAAAAAAHGLVLSPQSRLGTLQRDLLETLAERASARTTRQLADELGIRRTSPVLESLQSLAAIGLVHTTGSVRRGYGRGWVGTWACTDAGLTIAARVAGGEL